MKDDMISRQAALDALGNIDCSDGVGFRALKYDAINDAVTAIKALPPAQPRWIPCSERLPKPNEYENDVRVYYLVQNEYGDMMVCSWHGSYWTRIYRNTKVKDKVVAWMPLPEAYKEHDDD